MRQATTPSQQVRFFFLEDRQWWQVLTQNNSDKRCMRHHR
jgi:hypothetical protein